MAVVVLSALVAGGGGVAFKARTEAHRLVTSPRDVRAMPRGTPAEAGMPFEDVAVTTADGLRLEGWYVPSWNGATLLLVHGYKDTRGNLIGLARLLHRHGYSLLLGSLRAHDGSDGETISFGHHETKDLAAWHAWLEARAGVDASRVGIFGVSLGGTVAIRYAAETPSIAAVVADCAFSSIEDTVERSIRFFTGLPPFPFAPMIVFWTERRLEIETDTIDAKAWISRISPRPVFLLQGGADVVISPESGARLFAAAAEPKELWFEPDLGHTQFLSRFPDEFERRVVGFYHRYLTPK
jgi:pimeloyl-ACP methyl ester carboxylesterase